MTPTHVVCYCFFLAVLLDGLQCRSKSSIARPIWSIAHMANCISEMNEFVETGTNAIEVDIEFDLNGMPIKTNHVGIGCDCERDCFFEGNFVDYVIRVRELSDPESKSFSKNLVLVFFDLKTSGFEPEIMAEAGRNLGDLLAKHLWDYGTKELNIKVLFCLYGYESLVLAAAFHETLIRLKMDRQLATTGFDMTGYADLDSISNIWNEMNFTCRVWQGDGMSNCYYYSCDRLKKTIKLHSKNDSYMSKIYYWTVDDEDIMRNLLEQGVDAMITNYPEILLSLLNGTDYRLATSNDSPWTEFQDCLNNMISSDAAIALTKEYSSQFDEKFEMLRLLSTGWWSPSSRC